MEKEDIITVQNKFRSLLKDDIVKILLKNSHITKIQLETIFIDILAEEILLKKISFTEKVNFRIKDSKISRGSFIRTLKQTRNNITKSINTILLLGYLGLFDTPKLQPYIEISNRMHSLLDISRKSKPKIDNEVLFLLKRELIHDIQKGM